MTLEEIENGLILTVDKPAGWSSFQAVNKLKWNIRRELNLKKFKIGHAGALDPLATGLLLVCVGKATKRIEELQQGEKVYTGTIVLGATTPCHDLERPVDAFYPTKHLTPNLIKETIQRDFLGPIDQVPPMFSAIKLAGQRAYEYARDGELVHIEPKRVMIHQFEVTAWRNLDPPAELLSSPLPEPFPDAQTQLYRQAQPYPTELPQIDFLIRCGKGTYIRSIARDLGLSLGTGAFLGALRRERIGTHTLEGAIRLG